ncbi:aminotransferase class I/II-fold pyridoxal phosphate-dependent enzyme [Sedimentibacter hydroxybenzoicus DSM 7310]|uniref:L-methionine gamma-lyase n=1 Tax=Sedimentibacter hydroxybenzoicus DSM 7310 TaxID=1123245 RepID=A0A974BL01_SEDHY|nr:aminotransferase class I/II-fold pyridoxal phosphate-dependent enzyme [Sedimentibacter hydroxybenzoicus]NYB75093.1 aminotransferase class I/II-fold pyridoxal phosphate-dependent enzyme [Sedimentibacter hydroxybenzoicus DSM 7310]
MKFNTKTIHFGEVRDKQFGAHITPIYQTSTFIFDDCAQGGDRFAGRDDGYKYTRLGNPNTHEIARRMAALDETDMGLYTSTGMSAVSTALLGLMKSGDHLISSDCIYGGTVGVIDKVITSYGIEADYVKVNDYELFRKAFKTNTKVVYIETPANPTLELIDIKKVAEITHENGAVLIVDNTFLTPYLQRPMTLGADVAVYSVTKYINGHGDVVGGVITGKKEYINKINNPYLVNLGGTGSPFDAWLVSRGLKTLGLRMDRHCSNAMAVAKYLEANPKVAVVYYPGLESFPQHELAKKQMDDFGGMIAFELKGGFEAGEKLLNNLKIISLAVSLGGVDSLIQHPASMTHAAVPKEERLKGGITDGLVRLSVGIEDLEDIIEDIEKGFAKV